MVALQNHHEPPGNGFGLVHRVAQSPLGDLWLALDQRRGPPGEPVLVRYVSLSGGATGDALERVAAAGRDAMRLRGELLLPVVGVLQDPLAVVYEYVEAQPLSVLQSSARARELLFPVSVSLRLIIDLLRALQTLHESWPGWPTEAPFGGLLPASVLVSRDGRTRLCDALVSSAALLQRGSDLGAAELSYRAPEQVYASTSPEPSTDVFIATILLWELLSGRRLLSGPKEVIELKLLQHDLPRASADLRSDCQLSRGLLELVDCGLALDSSQRPATPAAFATALQRCGHAIASHADVAAFVNELAGPQLDRTNRIVRLALGYAAGADEGQLAAALRSDSAAPPSRLEAAPSSVATTASRPHPVVPLAPPGGGQEAARGGTNSLAGAVALALERRRRASGEFPAVAHELAALAPRATPLGVGAGPEPLAAAQALEQAAAADSAPRASVLPPAQGLPVVPPPLPASVPPPLPLLRPGAPADAAATELAGDAQPPASEEVTTVQRAVGEHGGSQPYTPASAPIRLAPKRALLAALAGVVLLIQLWMLEQARSRREREAEEERPRPELPAEPVTRAQPERAL